MKTFASYWRESNLDLAKTEEKLRPFYGAILQENFPQGVLQNYDFKMGNIEGEAGNSFSFRLVDGVWKDFAGEDEIKGKGILSLLATSRRVSREEVAVEMMGRFNFRNPTSGYDVPIPQSKYGEVKSLLAHWKNRSHHWVYKDTDGALLMVRVRYSSRDEPKRFCDITYNLDKDEISTKSFPGARPIYRLDLLEKYPSAKVMITEGEKDCDAAQKLLDEKYGEGAWVAVTWPGGAKTVTKTLWIHLRGRQIVLWPDNDAVGVMAMRELGSRLKKLEIPSELKMIQFLPEENVPPKFGLADEGADKLDLDVLIERAQDPNKDKDSGEWAFVGNVKRFVRLRDATLMDVEQFNLMHLHLSKNMAKEYLTDQEFQKFETFTFWPGKGRIVDEQMKGGKIVTALNLWNGVDHKIVEGALCERFNEHLEKVFPDAAVRNHFLNWVAHLVQHPGKKVMHAFLLQGREGIGKTYFARVFEKLFGSWNISYVGGTDLRSGYTSFMQSSQLVVVNELYDSARREVASVLKELITDPFYQYKEKFVPSVQLPNRANFFFTTNHDDSIIMGQEDRRYFVYFSPMTPERPEYYRKLWGSLDDEVPGIYTLLMSRDLSGFAAEAPPPRTAEKEEMIYMSMPVTDSYINQIRTNREWPMTSGKFTLKALGETLKTKYGVKATEHLLGRLLRKYGFVKGSQVTTDDGRSWIWYIDGETAGKDEKLKDTSKLPVNFVRVLEADAQAKIGDGRIQEFDEGDTSPGGAEKRGIIEEIQGPSGGEAEFGMMEGYEGTQEEMASRAPGAKRRVPDPMVQRMSILTELRRKGLLSGDMVEIAREMGWEESGEAEDGGEMESKEGGEDVGIDDL